MKGAKGVIISITGGEDMRLMEVDEAANHIRELVDPDANIIWGSAFNNDLQGRIRVSVVATGIGAEEVMPMPQPAKVFAFPARTAEPPRTKMEPVPEPTIEPAPITLTPPESPMSEMPAEMTAAEEEMQLEPEMMAELEAPVEEEAAPETEELLLDSVDMTADEPAAETAEEIPAAGGTRSWLTSEEPAEAPAPAPRQTGTLFERMSNIARGAAKAQVPEESAGEEEEEAPRMRAGGRDPLDIPRFLNRQNNQ
jgi:cell division protein FtsZ